MSSRRETLKAACSFKRIVGLEDSFDISMIV